MIYGVVLVLALAGSQNFGLETGAESTYVVHRGHEGDYTVVKTVGEPTFVRSVPVYEIICKYGTVTTYEHVGLTAAGVFEYYAQHMDGSGINTSLPPNPDLRTNMAVGAKWSWVEPFVGQTLSDANGKAPDMKDLETACVATLVSKSEKVTTPAGTFKTIHVHTVRHSKGLGDSVEDRYYSPAVGLVKMSHQSKEWSSVQELTRHKGA